MSNILVINGPNLNLLGVREPEIYGEKSLDQINQELTNIAKKYGCSLEAYQSNSESELVNIVQEKSQTTDYMILNPGAFTHYSYAIRDAISAVEIPTVEVHLSDIHNREDFRQQSVISSVCKKQISGLGKQSYLKGLEVLLK